MFVLLNDVSRLGRKLIPLRSAGVLEGDAEGARSRDPVEHAHVHLYETPTALNKFSCCGELWKFF